MIYSLTVVTGSWVVLGTSARANEYICFRGWVEGWDLIRLAYAPLKPMTIPRLELAAALMSVKISTVLSRT